MELTESQQLELGLRLALQALEATGNGFDVKREGYYYWAISSRQRDELRMCAFFLAEALDKGKRNEDTTG